MTTVGVGILHWIVPIIEIGVIAVLLNYLLSFFWNTRAMDLIIGFLGVLVLFVLASWFHLPVLQKILFGVVEVLVLAVLIIFQPELRIALSRLSFKGKRFKVVSEFDRLLEQLAGSVYRMAEKRIGAIVAIENQDSLEEFAIRGILLNANFSSELLESIFMPSTPLHDGAVILRERTVMAASAILPLADDASQVARSMGTRHRAGLGLSQMTDALVIVISEESGKVSIARDGMMTRGVKADRLKGIVRSLFNPPVKKTGFNLLEWLKS